MNEKYNSLDSLRAYGALGILIMHVLANVPVRPVGGFLFDTFIPSLTHFVYLFIVISAFGLCCGYYDKFKAGTISPNESYLKRYKRLLPFFALLVFIDTVVPHAPNKYEIEHMAAEELPTGSTVILHSLYDAFAELTLAFNLLPNPSSPIGVAWFLGLIFLFYMIFPYFVFLMDNKRRAWLSLGLCYLFSFCCSRSKSSCVNRSDRIPQRRQASSKSARLISVCPVASSRSATFSICSSRMPLYPASSIAPSIQG